MPKNGIERRISCHKKKCQKKYEHDCFCSVYKLHIRLPYIRVHFIFFNERFGALICTELYRNLLSECMILSNRWFRLLFPGFISNLSGSSLVRWTPASLLAFALSSHQPNWIHTTWQLHGDRTCWIDWIMVFGLGLRRQNSLLGNV